MQHEIRKAQLTVSRDMQCRTCKRPVQAWTPTLQKGEPPMPAIMEYDNRVACTERKPEGGCGPASRDQGDHKQESSPRQPRRSSPLGYSRVEQLLLKLLPQPLARNFAALDPIRRPATRHVVLSQTLSEPNQKISSSRQ